MSCVVDWWCCTPRRAPVMMCENALCFQWLGCHAICGCRAGLTRQLPSRKPTHYQPQRCCLHCPALGVMCRTDPVCSLSHCALELLATAIVLLPATCLLPSSAVLHLSCLCRSTSTSTPHSVHLASAASATLSTATTVHAPAAWLPVPLLPTCQRGTAPRELQAL